VCCFSAVIRVWLIEQSETPNCLAYAEHMAGTSDKEVGRWMYPLGLMHGLLVTRMRMRALSHRVHAVLSQSSLHAPARLFCSGLISALMGRPRGHVTCYLEHVPNAGAWVKTGS
jgi:hypothetical protein